MFSTKGYCLKKSLLGMALVILVYSNALSQAPNVIYIMADDMGYGDLSSYGCKDYTTPNLDKLAAQGVKFVNAYSAAPICTPTRAAFFTGRFPARTTVGLIEPLTGNKSDTTFGLTNKIPSIATVMKSAGYQTALIGKWHLGSQPQHSPLKNGLDYFFGIRGGAADYLSHSNGWKHDLYENDSLVYPEGYLTDLFTKKAVAFIKQKHNKPFFLSVTYTAPHWPWQGPNDKPYADSIDFRSGGSPSIYAEMMKYLDEGVGNILKALDEEHLSHQTIVIFTNDNGGEKYSDNGGFKKSKGTLWEGGIKVPALVRWTGQIKAGTLTQQVAITMDWSATILAAGGATMHKDFPLDGLDLMPILTGKKKDIDRTFYWRTFQRTKHKAIRDGRWKYLSDEAGEYLFDMVADPTESSNLKEKHQDVFNTLKNKHSKWEQTVLQPIPL